MDIRDFIPYDKGVTRAELCRLTGMGDRQVREAIARARQEGEIIINIQDGDGYRRTEDLDEMARQYKQDTARAMAILVRRKALRRRLKEAGRPV